MKLLERFLSDEWSERFRWASRYAAYASLGGLGLNLLSTFLLHVRFLVWIGWTVMLGAIVVTTASSAVHHVRWKRRKRDFERRMEEAGIDYEAACDEMKMAVTTVCFAHGKKIAAMGMLPGAPYWHVLIDDHDVGFVGNAGNDGWYAQYVDPAMNGKQYEMVQAPTATIVLGALIERAIGEPPDPFQGPHIVH